MNILRRAQRNISNLGIDSQQAIQKHPFNCRNVLALLVLSLSTVACGMHFFRLANTFIEHTYSIYTFSSMFLSTAILLIILSKMRLYFEILAAMEKAINERKQTSIIVLIQ